jgi:hypothetical protein
MLPIVYHDLAEFGLPFVTSADSTFAGLLAEIRSHPQPFEPELASDPSPAVVLLNQSGKAIVTLSYIWKFTMAGGHTRTSRYSNLGSSMQMDVLTGRASVTRDRGSFILPGSKRLITLDGMFGDNSDVLPAESASHGGGCGGIRGGAGMSRVRGQEEIVGIELYLDVVVLEDGLCIGPDDFGLFENLVEDLKRQRDAAQEVAEALRNGASIGHAFEIVRPLARHIGPESAASRLAWHSQLLSMFAGMAIHQLVHGSESEVLGWFEKAAQPSPVQLHRPS